MQTDKPGVDSGGAWRPTSATDRMQYLDTVRLSRFARQYKSETFGALGLGEGDRVLEVGCGTGDDAIEMAKLVGSTGRVTGVDNDGHMLEVGRRRAVEAGVTVEFQVADVHHLPFDDRSFDACRADRVFMHLEDPLRALSEMVRVLRPGGRVLVVEPDWETIVVDSPDRDTTRAIVHMIADENIRHGWIGRQLPALFKNCGLSDIRASLIGTSTSSFKLAERVLSLRRNVGKASREGLISPQQARQWMDDLQKAGEEDRFFAAIGGLQVFGRKP